VTTPLTASERADLYRGAWDDDVYAAAEQIIARREAAAWDEAVRECHDLGWLHDWAKSDAISRNPYRTTEATR